MYRVYDDRYWYGGLYRKDLISQHIGDCIKKGCGKVKKNRVYLSDVANLEGKIIIAKPVDIVIVSTEGNKSDVRTIYNYTFFKDYVEFYHYIKHTDVKLRMFHEVTPEYSSQKARFDVDIERVKYESFIKKLGIEDVLNVSFEKFGEYIKDLVIRNVIEVLKDYKLPFNIERDVCIFTSHRKSKRSYHVIINRYFHYGSIQAQEFYKLCLDKCLSHIDTKLFKTFIDAGIYDRNHPLRTWHSIKKENGVCYEKKFVEEFAFEGKKYKHQLDDEAFSEEEDDEISDKLRKKIRKLHILHRSLITYTNESVPLPSFAVTKIDRNYNNSMSEKTYKECCELISAWDKEKIFTIDGEEDGQIHLHRNAPSLCEICRPIREGTGESPIHDNMNAFCYLHKGHLYWHCYRAKGYSGICIGMLKSYRNESDAMVDDYLKDIIEEGGEECLILEEDGTEYQISETKIKYEDEVAKVTVNEDISSCSGESFSDDSCSEISEDVNFIKVKAIAPNKLITKVSVPFSKKVMIDGTNDFLAKVSCLTTEQKDAISIVVPEKKDVVSIVPTTAPLFIPTPKKKELIDPGKGKSKESISNVGNENKSTPNFAQNLRRGVKPTTSVVKTVDGASKSVVKTNSRFNFTKKTLGESSSFLKSSQEFTKSKTQELTKSKPQELTKSKPQELTKSKTRVRI